MKPLYGKNKNYGRKIRKCAYLAFEVKTYVEYRKWNQPVGYQTSNIVV
jgi:hypothetical protein